MGFGRNPHVVKAQAAEQKARDARDDASRTLAWREAARLWDRAADREQSDKLRLDYTNRAEAARAEADGPEAGTVECEVHVTGEVRDVESRPAKSVEADAAEDEPHTAAGRARAERLLN
jgi:hypothetical protein